MLRITWRGCIPYRGIGLEISFSFIVLLAVARKFPARNAAVLCNLDLIRTILRAGEEIICKTAIYFFDAVE
jgi:hypothetical protein